MEVINTKDVMSFIDTYENSQKKRRDERLGLLYFGPSQLRYLFEKFPKFEAEPVRHGEWINGTLGTECSCCGDLLPIVWCPDDENGEHCIEIDETPYCPNCGAKMKGLFV